MSERRCPTCGAEIPPDVLDLDWLVTAIRGLLADRVVTVDEAALERAARAMRRELAASVERKQ